MPPTGSCPLAAFQPAFDQFILCACKAHVEFSSPGRNRTMARAKTDSGPLSRREFLGATATAALSTSSLLKTARAQDASEPKPWYSVMRRCGQINVNERDPLTLDADAWMDYWASLKVDAVLLNGGGILAFYPTRVPFHHRSQYLGSRDLFGEMVAAAKKRGLRVVARMDCNFAYAEAFPAHARGMHLALQDLHVQLLFHRTDARHLSRDRFALSRGRILHQRLAEHG